MVERGRRASVSTYFADGAFAVDGIVALPEAAAHHARVKRQAAGDRVRLTNGAGQVAEGAIRRIARTEVEVQVDAVRVVPRPAPLALYAPVGDRERMLWLAEKATELGATSWHPVSFRRSRSVSPRGEGAAFAQKVRARMIGAVEQSGGAWLPELHGEITVEAAARVDAPATRFLLDAEGGRFDAGPAAAGAAIILGPEGGMEPDERDLLVAGGWRPVALAATILRFETAGVAAMAIVRAAHLSPAGEPHG